MNPKIKCIIILYVAFAAFSASYAANEVTCTRTLPANYVPGENVTVTLTIDVDENNLPNAFGIEETFPSGWTFVSASPQPGQNVPPKLGWLFWAPGTVADTTITYIVTPPAGETGTKTFTGEVSYNYPVGTPHEYPTGGDTQIEQKPSEIPTVGFISTTSSGFESVTAVDLEVVLSEESSEEVKVDYAVTGGTAAGEGEDYTLDSGTLIFSAGSISEKIAITVVDDSLNEADETIEVTLSNPLNATLGANTIHTYTIEDNEALPSVGFDVDSSNDPESTGSVDLIVNLSPASGLPVKVDYSVAAGGTADGGGVDYTLANGTLTFSPGDTSEKIAITVVDDLQNEVDETIIVTLSNPTNATLSITTHTYTILDNDTEPSVEFSSVGSQGEEGAVSQVLLVVNLSPASGKSVTVGYSVGGTASGGGVDYTLADGTLTFSPGQTTKNIILTIEDDGLVETDETVIVTLSSPTNATLGANEIYTYTIIDDDIAGIAFAGVSSSGSESVTAVTLDVVLSPASVEEVKVDYLVTGGSAKGGGVDYTLDSGTLIFSVGSTSEKIAITVVDDSIYEDDETIEFTLSNPLNAELGSIITHTYTIIDDEALPIVGFDAGTSDGLEDNSPAELMVSMSAESSLLAKVYFSITPGTATGGDDYTIVDGWLEFSPGETGPESIKIPILDDFLDEDNETITVELSAPENAELGTASHTYTIIDNDDEPSVEFTGSSSLQDEEGAVSQVSMDVELSPASGRTVTVDYTVAGDADVGVDYTIAAGPLTFLPGETTKNISLTILDDSAGEADETIIVTLSGPTNAAIGTMASYTYTIINDDLSSIEFAEVSSSGPESDSSVELTVTLLPEFPQTAKVDYSVTVTAGSADGGGVDYTLLGTGVLEFSSGSTSEKIAITVVDDSSYEGDETIIVTLSNPTNATLGTYITYTYTIEDNDEPPIIEFAEVSSSGDEGITEVLMSVKISEVSGVDAKVYFSITPGTAIGGKDYEILSGWLDFFAGDTGPEDIKITIIDDLSYENNETFTVELSAPEHAILGTNTSYTYTIIDNDDPPEVSFTSADSQGEEGEGGVVSQVTMVVELSPASGKTVTVDYLLSGKADVGVDYTIAAGPLTFSPGETTKNIPIYIHDDSEVEPEEKIIVTLSNPTNATIGTEGIYTHKIINDDQSNIEFAEASSSGPEGNSPAELIVTLSPEFPGEVTVNYSVTGGTAIEGQDYTVSAEPLPFPAGDTEESIKIIILPDGLVEPDKTIIVTLSNPSPSGDVTIGTNASHTYTILNDDDKTDPNTYGHIPELNSIQVARDTIIQLHITDEVIAGTSGTGVALGTVEIKVEDDVIYDGANETDPNVYDSTGTAQTVKGICRRVGSEADYMFVFQSSTLFDYEQEVDVVVKAEDKAGNPITEDYNFHTVMRSFGKNIKVNTDTGTLVQNNPATARDSEGNIWVVWDEKTAAGDTDIYIGKLPADGSAFKTSVPVISNPNNQRNPAIAIDDANNLYVVWEEIEEIADPNWDILLLTSEDGITWTYELGSDPCQVNADNPDEKAPNIAQNPAIAISGTEMYITWDEKRAGNKDIWVRKSDIGQDPFYWKVATQVTDDASSQSGPAIAIDENGTAYIVWTDERNAGNDTGMDIFGADSPNWTNVEVVEISDNQWSPAIATESSGTVLHLLWVDDADPNDSIFHGVTTGGLQELLEADIHDVVDEPNYPQSAPAIAVDGAGETAKVFACWRDERNIADPDIYYAESGSNFGTNILVNDDEGANIQTAPAIGIDDGNPYMGWVDNRLGNNDIYGAGSTSLGPALAEVDVSAASGGTVESGDVLIEIPAGALPVDIKITIAEMINLPELPPGGFGVPYAFGPSGLVFSQPVTVTIQHAEEDCPGHSVYRVYSYQYDQGTGLGYWSQEGISDVQHLTNSDEPSLPLNVHAIRFKTTHFTGFGTGGGAAPAAVGGGGGGGGGCDISPAGQGNVIEYLLPYIFLTVVWVIIKRRDARNRRTI